MTGYPVSVGKSFRDRHDAPEMVVIPEGQFVMGSDPGEYDRDVDEGPQRVVKVNSPLAVARFAVTVGEYKAFVNATDHKHADDAGRNWLEPGFSQNDRHPVTCVNWFDAQQYVRWLSCLTQQSYRLLTEAEWEYACRSGTTTPYFFGNNITICQANFDRTNGGTVPVGLYPANNFGLEEMHGQVWEWVEDAWHNSYCGASADASCARLGTDNQDRILRGGSWSDSMLVLRSARRQMHSPTGQPGSYHGRYHFVGFRVARLQNGSAHP